MELSRRTKNATQASASKSRASASKSSSQQQNKQKQPQQVFDIDDDDDDEEERDELATSQPVVASTSSKSTSSRKTAASTSRNHTRSPTPELPPPLQHAAPTNGHDGEDDELLDENGYDEDDAPEGLMPTATILPEEEREEDCIKVSWPDSTRETR
jgi:hypothetical protein